MNEKSKQKLKDILIDVELLDLSYQKCIDWAVEELVNGEDDLDVCILAGANINDIEEIKMYIRKIVPDYDDNKNGKMEERAGAIVVEYGQKYFDGEITVWDLDKILDKLYVRIDYSDWLVMLGRNCEYATDIDCFFMPFEKELRYIMGLWQSYPRYEEFKDNYDRNTSNKNSC